MPRKKEMSFEESLEKLETIVKDMENGDSSLKELMENYTEGIKLGEACLKELAKAEAALDIAVSEENGTVTETALDIKGE
ncbi:MAG: exodeoxyribonuclease VII small subunit [Selenomonas sp.]|nr:exodeoxyribonuclease VII small subunit [Selenomonas sp.]